MLHKASYIKGFHLVARDGSIGHVDDVLIDEAWSVRYVVVDTSNWIGGKWVLVSPGAITEVDSPNRKIRVGLSRAEIERSPGVEQAPVELVETLPSFVII